jgi:hypothetical protein
MSRNVQVVIVCEDRQHEAFARRFLARAGKQFRVQRVERSPKGRGTGEQYVRERFAKELAGYRARRHKGVEGQAVVVLVDADVRSVAERIEQLETGGSDVHAARRRAGERVAIFVPARNIETWLAYLDGQTVNEQDDYPRLKRERNCQRHVDRLYDMCQRKALRDPAPPSLQAACVEYQSRLQS